MAWLGDFCIFYSTHPPQVISSFKPSSMSLPEWYFCNSSLIVSFPAYSHSWLSLEFKIKFKLLTIYSEDILCLPLARVLASSPTFPFAFSIPKSHIVAGTYSSLICICSLICSSLYLGLPPKSSACPTPSPSKLTWNISTLWSFPLWGSCVLKNFDDFFVITFISLC